MYVACHQLLIINLAVLLIVLNEGEMHYRNFSVLIRKLRKMSDKHQLKGMKQLSLIKKNPLAVLMYCTVMNKPVHLLLRHWKLSNIFVNNFRFTTIDQVKTEKCTKTVDKTKYSKYTLTIFFGFFSDQTARKWVKWTFVLLSVSY